VEQVGDGSVRGVHGQAARGAGVGTVYINRDWLLTWRQTGLTGAESGLARLLIKQGVARSWRWLRQRGSQEGRERRCCRCYIITGSLLTWGQIGLTGAEGGLARLLVKQGVEEVGDGPVQQVHRQAARGAAVAAI
jgi:hypothetical protein